MILVKFFSLVFSIHLLELYVFLKFVHILQVLLVLHFKRCHWECFLVEKGYDAFLAEHEFDHTLSFVLIEFVFFFASLVGCI